MPKKTIKIAEMFAGVGGFRLGLDGYSSEVNSDFNLPPAGPFKTIWANQWEPPGLDSKQFAWRCYEKRFGEGSCINQDINKLLDEVEKGDKSIPDFDLLVGGFPCQDYSVAKPLARSGGIEGQKGVLWWDIYRMLLLKKPKMLLLENVDRLLKSPVSQRGRDFAIILSCLNKLGYSVEWRVINAADYGMPQRRRRVYIFGIQTDDTWDKTAILQIDGVMAKAFPIENGVIKGISIPKDPYKTSKDFGKGLKVSPFESAGVMQDGEVLTSKITPVYKGTYTVLKDLIVKDNEVPDNYFIKKDDIPKWEYQRSAKKEPRTAKNGHEYIYSEGSMAFPDPIDKPARTILTGESGAGASRMKHAIKGDSGRIRRLVPDELDQIQMFPKGWTDTGMTDAQRAFCMGNALVVGIPHKIGIEIAKLF